MSSSKWIGVNFGCMVSSVHVQPCVPAQPELQSLGWGPLSWSQSALDTVGENALPELQPSCSQQDFMQLSIQFEKSPGLFVKAELSLSQAHRG